MSNPIDKLYTWTKL